MDEVLCNALRTAFSSQYAFYVKAQDAHWNVIGEDFYEAHLLFERIYSEVGGIIDTFAENLRKAQCMVPAGFTKMQGLSVIEDFPADELDLMTMYQSLLDDSDRLAELFAAANELCEKRREHGLANFFADRQDAQRGHSWMLRSVLTPTSEED